MIQSIEKINFIIEYNKDYNIIIIIMMQVPYIPEVLLHIILEYDGRIKYKNRKYVNIIHNHDERYNIIAPIISKKIEIMKTIELKLDRSGFYFEFCLNKTAGLVYDYNFSYKNVFEICYFDFKNDTIQIRTYL